jgi:hypothetical protein
MPLIILLGIIIIQAGGIPLLTASETHEEAPVIGDGTLDYRSLSEYTVLLVFDTLERRINLPDRVATQRMYYDNARSLLERRGPDQGLVQRLQHLDNWSLNTLFAIIDTRA